MATGAANVRLTADVGITANVIQITCLGLNAQGPSKPHVLGTACGKPDSIALLCQGVHL